MFAILLLTCISAHAIERSSADIASLNYYPRLHRLETTARLALSLHDTSESSSGASVKKAYETVTLGADYGLGRGWRIGVSESVSTGQSNQNYGKGGGETDSSNGGFSDPALSLVWRTLESNSDGLSADLGAVYSPSLGPKTVDNGNRGHTGNYLNGYWTASAYGALFWRWGINEMELRGAYNQDGQGHTDGDGPATTFTLHPAQYPSASLNDRLHLTKEVYLQLGGMRVSSHSVENLNGNGVERKVQIPAHTVARIDVGFRLGKQTLLELTVTDHLLTTETTTAGGTVSNRNKQNLAYLTFLHQI